ncbi:hypothetical protein [Massilia sp. Root351]|uniref:hypothetical protein n=1 Tax=Massilia sp. Root351 TaxID=1736522 RepID=UPI000ACF2B2B|nr:hypothetical protein [Massilia sp. Root351]
MQIPSFDVSKFFELIAARQFKKAVQTIFGVGDKPVVYARALIEHMYRLDATDRQELLKWSSAPMEPEPLEELRWYVDQIAQHEVGHAIAARLLGFSTGTITLNLVAADGNHIATTAIDLDTPSLDQKGLREYLEKRIMVLMAGSMAEAESTRYVRENFEEAFLVATSDQQKCDELFQVLLNMHHEESDVRFTHYGQYREYLVERTIRLLAPNHAVIAKVAKAMSQTLTNYGQVGKWTAEDFNALLAAEKLVNHLE